MLDRPGIPNYREPSLLLTLGLIKLRDLDDNLWNADQLFILTATREQALEMARVIEDEEWPGAQPTVYDNQQDIDAALGIGRQKCGLLSIWWD